MGDETQYNYELSYNDGSADGIHERGAGNEAAVEAAIAKRWHGAWYEPTDDGWDVYTSEEDAGDESKLLGKVRSA